MKGMAKFMKKLLSLFMVVTLLFALTACRDSNDSERKRAKAGQSTITLTKPPSNDIVLDTGLLNPLTETYAKSNKANLVYDPNVLIDLANKSDEKINIACIGDDITLGSLVDVDDAAVEQSNSYPTQLQQMLDTKFPNKFKVGNYGHSGSYVADFNRSNASTLRYSNTDEYIKLRKDKPEVVIIMLGINDMTYITDAKSYAEFVTAYTDLINGIKNMESKPIVFVCTPLIRVTSYSNYVTGDPLRSAAVESANKAGAYVIDTYNITKEYFESALYKTDGLHPDSKGYGELAKVIFNAISEGYTNYKEGTVKDTDYVVYVNADKGSYESLGKTPDNPTTSLARAIDLCRGGGTIVVSGPINPATTDANVTKSFIAPKNKNKIKITSVYNGVDYRVAGNGNAKIILSGNTYLHGDFEFENVTFAADGSSLKFVCNYNNITFGDGIACNVLSGGRPVLIYGYDVVSKWQSEADVSCNESCTLTINSGIFTYLRGGNYRAYSEKPSQLAYGTIKSGVTVNIIVNGGTFEKTDGTNRTSKSGSLTSAIGQNGMESGAQVNFTVNGGIFAGSVFAVPRMNPYLQNKAPTVAGDINITVNGGVIRGKNIDYRQQFSGDIPAEISGKYHLTIKDKDAFTANGKSFSASGCEENSILTLDPTCIDLKDLATNFKIIN